MEISPKVASGTRTWGGQGKERLGGGGVGTLALISNSTFMLYHMHKLTDFFFLLKGDKIRKKRAMVIFKTK
jgi:hypothetical protein